MKDNDLTTITIRVKTKDYKLFKRKCKSEDRSMAFVIRDAIKKYIREEPETDFTVTDTMDVTLMKSPVEEKSWIKKILKR